MRFVSFDDGRGERVGVAVGPVAGAVVGAEVRVVDLARADPGLPRSLIGILEAGESALARVRDVVARATDQDCIALSAVRLLAPVPRPRKILCIGHNYRDHSGAAVPEYPTFFSKHATTVVGSGATIELPPLSAQVDNEAELAVVIGRPVRRIPESQAMDAIAGYTIFNDVSARDFQKRSSQWMLGKNFDGFGPMGPMLVTTDEIPDPAALELELRVNGEAFQRASTSQFIFPIPFLIAYLSAVMTLEPGDVISTGTPSRLGRYEAERVWMKPGDEVRIGITGLGELVNRYVGSGS